MIDHAAVTGEVAQRHFHQHNDFFALRLRFLHELGLGAIQHVDGHFGDGPETAAFDEDRLFVEHFGGLHYFAVCGEHRGIRQSLRDELQCHQTIVEVLERRTGELDHVHFDPVAREIIH